MVSRLAPDRGQHPIEQGAGLAGEQPRRRRRPRRTACRPGSSARPRDRPPGAIRGADGDAKGRRSVSASQAAEGVEARPGIASAGAGAAAAARPRLRPSGLSQSRGVSPTSVSTPASSHHERALAAQLDAICRRPRESVRQLESAGRGLVNRGTAVYLPDGWLFATTGVRGGDEWLNASRCLMTW